MTEMSAEDMLKKWYKDVPNIAIGGSNEEEEEEGYTLQDIIKEAPKPRIVREYLAAILHTIKELDDLEFE